MSNSPNMETLDIHRWPPGTVQLETLHGRNDGEIILHPNPSHDPNDPLNWSKQRKAINFGLTCFYTLMIFVLVDIGTVIYGPLMTELGFGTGVLNASFGTNTAGLAVGCIIFIPFALKFGRRPIYLLSIAMSLASATWSAKMRTSGDLYGTSALSGIAGSISETLCQMTIADLFFVHQRATMNAIYLVTVTIGAYLGPVAAGYAADSQGWRWIWWWTVMVLAVCLVLFIFCYEETKFIPSLSGESVSHPRTANERFSTDQKRKDSAISRDVVEPLTTVTSRMPNIKQKTYRQRMSLLTTTPGSLKDFVRHVYQPFIALFTIPGVAFCALIYGSLLAWFSLLLSVMSIYMTYAPYNFTSSGIGLMNLAPFIGSLMGGIYAGPLSDYCIIWLSRRNGGIYEPEMRLWLAFPAVVVAPLSVLMFGLCLVNSVHWIALAMAVGIFGFSSTTLGDIALTYLIDSYKDIVGDSLVAVAFVRNAFATIVAMALTPWIDGMGLLNVFILSAVLCLVIFLTTVPMLIWGKRLRVKAAPRYANLARRQFDARGLE